MRWDEMRDMSAPELAIQTSKTVRSAGQSVHYTDVNLYDPSSRPAASCLITSQPCSGRTNSAKHSSCLTSNWYRHLANFFEI